MMTELIHACFFIFIAEMGDKTQILAMTFATKYPARKVLLGVFFGSLLNHALAVFLGFYLSKTISITILQLIAACSFIFFGLWSLVQKDTVENEKTIEKYGAITTVATAFFLGELGDKTQLTAVALATQSNFPYLILMGTVLGMVLTSGIGIWVGSKIGKRIPELTLKLASSGIFLTFGIVKLLQSIPSDFITIYTVSIFGASLTAILIYLLRPFIDSISYYNTPLKATAQQLYLNTLRIQASLQNLCAEKSTCDSCQNRRCSIYLLNHILSNAKENNQYLIQDVVEFPINDSTMYNKEQLKKSLKIVIDTCLHCQEHQKKCVGNIAREILEKQYFGKTLPFTGDFKTYCKEIEALEKDFFQYHPSAFH